MGDKKWRRREDEGEKEEKKEERKDEKGGRKERETVGVIGTCALIVAIFIQEP